jgi:hypothetical protein
VQRRTFDPKREDVTGDWRRMHYAELHDLYTSPTIIRRMRWAGHVASMGEMICIKYFG